MLADASRQVDVVNRIWQFSKIKFPSKYNKKKIIVLLYFFPVCVQPGNGLGLGPVPISKSNRTEEFMFLFKIKMNHGRDVNLKIK